MTQVIAVAIAAFFLGIGMAGAPLEPVRAAIAGAVLIVVAVVMGVRAAPVPSFFFGFVGVLFACFLQHQAIYPGTGVVAVGLGLLAASSFGRKMAPAVIAGFGAALGIGLFLLNTTF